MITVIPVVLFCCFYCIGVVFDNYTGGNTVKVWDALAGGKLMMELNNHHKTVMSVSFSSDFSRLLTAGLDRSVSLFSLYSLSSLQCIYLFRLSKVTLRGLRL